METELISREIIKPSSPTPPHLRNYTLSFIDQFTIHNYMPLVYFYPSKASDCDQRSKISKLKKSLSQVLSRYYPFAGRLGDQISIDCNDQGVLLLVTQIRFKLSAILQNPSEASLNALFPDELHWQDMDSNAGIVPIQINCFACGGIAISVCLSHKVGDASTLFNFVNDWATLNRRSSDEDGELTLPDLDVGASVFPQGDLPVSPETALVKDNTVCRRFVFEASKIESLKAMVSSDGKVQNPTRVEVIMALIYKSAVSALGLTAETTQLRVTINLRTRMVPPLPDKSTGNLVSFFLICNQGEAELHDLVSKTKEALSEFCGKHVKNFGGKDSLYLSEYLKQASGTPETLDQTYFWFSSWCRFPLYEADFGWGKPVWATMASGCPAKNIIYLKDTRDGKGIEALVNMEEQDMAKLERDVELLQYASLDPPIGYANGS